MAAEKPTPVLRASTVSRQLHNAGFTISHAARRYRHEGIFVSGKGRVGISVDLDAPGERQHGIDAIVETLTSLGYQVDAPETGSECGAIYVEKG